MERDTAPAVAARYHQRIGALPGARRLDIAAQLSAGVRAMAEAGLPGRQLDGPSAPRPSSSCCASQRA